MVSLEKLVVQLRQKKQEATKLRQKAEKQLKEIRSIERRSSSGLNSIDRKIESEREDVSDTSQILTRKTSQLESIERLVAAAEERLTQEKEIIEQTEQEIEFSENPEEKQNAEFRLRALNNHVQELAFEIKSRQKTAKKILDDGIPPRTFFNLNVPDVNNGGVKGIKITRMGIRIYERSVCRRNDP
ncbi:MAG: hypothetical protein QQN41_09800, partial [Nitrosopumilus sp.]